MKEVKFKYFVNGVETELRNIDWQKSTSIEVGESECYITIPEVDYISNRRYETAQDCIGVSDSSVGVKHNKNKAPLDILQARQFPKALQVLALATAFGNKKYEKTDKDFLNFKRVSGGSQTYFDAAARHNAQRESIDNDSKLPHLIHAVWNMLAALEISIEENSVDVQEFSKNYLEYLHNTK